MEVIPAGFIFAQFRTPPFITIAQSGCTANDYNRLYMSVKNDMRRKFIFFRILGRLYLWKFFEIKI